MEDPDPESIRTFLRAVGPLVLVAGLLFTGIGMADFFAYEPRAAPALPGPSGPELFWMVIVGLPLIAVGAGMVKWGYLRTIASYGATEVSPALETGAGAVAKGLNQGLAGDARTCPGCGADNDPDARFCDDCGTALAVACPDCGEVNDADARFCDDCGTALSA